MEENLSFIQNITLSKVHILFDTGSLGSMLFLMLYLCFKPCIYTLTRSFPVLFHNEFMGVNEAC